MKKQRMCVRHFVQTSTFLCALFAAIVCAACGTVPQSSSPAHTPTSTFKPSHAVTISATASPSVTPSATTTPPVTTPTNTPIPTATATSPASSVAAMATNYYQALEQQNYTLAYSFLDPNAINTSTNQKLTLEVFTALAQSTDTAEGLITTFSVGAFPPLVVMTVTRKYGPYHAHLQVKREGSTWKITSLDRI